MKLSPHQTNQPSIIKRGVKMELKLSQFILLKIPKFLVMHLQTFRKSTFISLDELPIVS